MNEWPAKASLWGQKELLRFGERILREDTLEGQCKWIKQKLQLLIDGEVTLWLSEEFLPLPNEENYVPFQCDKQTPLMVKAISSDKKKNRVYSKGRNEFAFSLRINSEIIGAIQASSKNPLNEEKIQILHALIPQISFSLFVGQQIRIKNWQNQQLDLVRSAATKIVQQRDIKEIYQYIVDLIQETFQYYFVAIYILDGKAKNLKYEAGAGKELSGEQYFELIMREGIPVGKGLVGQCAQEEKYIIVPEVQKESNYRFVTSFAETRSEVCILLKIGKKVLGVLDVQSNFANAFHENDVLVFRTLADAISVAIEGARLYASSLQQAWIATVMLQVSEAARSIENLDELLGTIARLIRLLVGIDRCAFYLINRQDEFQFRYAGGFNQEETQKIRQLPKLQETGAYFNLIKSTNEIEKIFQFNLSSLHLKGTYKLFPLTIHSRILGALLIEYEQMEELNDMGFTQVDVIKGVTRQTAVALENIRLLAVEQSEAYVTAVLLQVAEAVVNSNNLDDVLESIINILPILVGIDCAVFFLWDENRQVFHTSKIYSGNWKNELDKINAFMRPHECPTLELSLQSKNPVFIPIPGLSPKLWLNKKHKKAISKVEFSKLSSDFLIVYPLQIMNDYFGALLVTESKTQLDYREKRLEIMNGVAQQVALAIQNERLRGEIIDRERLQQEFLLAREIQRSFLPEQLPEIIGWELSAQWRPAKEVGGDFYDVFVLSKNKVGLVIADVSDKGIPAALYMTVVRTLIRVNAKKGISPADTLLAVNKDLLDTSPQGLFITTIYGILEIDSGYFVYSNAGHSCPVLLRKGNDKSRWLEKGSMPLGVDTSLKLENQKIKINVGDYLILYTDGVTEAQSPDGKLFGEKNLLRYLVANYGKSTNELIDGLEKAVLIYQKGLPQSDDFTVLGLHHT